MLATASTPRAPTSQPGSAVAGPGAAGFLRRHMGLLRALKWILIAGIVLTMWALAAGILG